MNDIYRNCPICGSSEKGTSYLHRLEPIVGISLLSEFSVITCGDCGMIYADSVPNQNEVDVYYANFSKYESVNHGDHARRFYNDVSNYIDKKIKDKQAFIADIGCGRGIILDNLKGRGYENLIGIELSSNNCDIIRKNNISVINKSLFELELEDFPRKLDVIFLTGVLEHVRDLHAALKVISKLLASDGVLIITVPLLDISTKVTAYPFRDFSMEHINYFSLDSLETLMRLHGLKLQEGKEFNYDGSTHLFASFNMNNIENNLQEYISICSDNLSETIKLIDSYALSQKPVVLYGAGTFCEYLLANTRLSECNIRQIVDGNINYHGHTLKGKTIESPLTLTDDIFNDADIFIITYLYNKEISAYIRDMNLDNNIITFPVQVDIL